MQSERERGTGNGSSASERRRRVGLVLSCAATLPLGGCIGVIAPKGPVADAQLLMLYNSIAVMLVVVIPVIAMAVGFGWWYRASNLKATYRPDWAYSGRVELVVWAIPLLIILFLGGIAWIGSHDLDPRRPLESSKEPMEVQVVSLDWKWLFIYPSLNVASVNELVLPAGTPIRFRTTSSSVMNSFFVPQLGTSIYNMNGMETVVHLQADEPGVFEGLSVHYSGDGFSDMRFQTRAMPDGEFAQWVGAARGAGETLDTANYGRLVQQSIVDAPYTYRAVQSGLFNAIVLQTAPDGPGPSEGHPSVDVSPRSEG